VRLVAPVSTQKEISERGLTQVLMSVELAVPRTAKLQRLVDLAGQTHLSAALSCFEQNQKVTPLEQLAVDQTVTPLEQLVVDQTVTPLEQLAVDQMATLEKQAAVQMVMLEQLVVGQREKH
jgi:hypothetical protein